MGDDWAEDKFNEISDAMLKKLNGSASKPKYWVGIADTSNPNKMMGRASDNKNEILATYRSILKQYILDDGIGLGDVDKYHIFFFRLEGKEYKRAALDAL